MVGREGCAHNSLQVGTNRKNAHTNDYGEQLPPPQTAVLSSHVRDPL